MTKTDNYSVMCGGQQLAWFKDKNAAFEYRDTLDGVAFAMLKSLTDSGRAPVQTVPEFYVIAWKGSDGKARRINR